MRYLTLILLACIPVILAGLIFQTSEIIELKAQQKELIKGQRELYFKQLGEYLQRTQGDIQ